MPTHSLSVTERKELRAFAHHLKPVVQIGEHGLRDAVLKEINTHLLAHQLIKIRVSEDDRSLRAEYFNAICAQLEAEPIHHIGKTLIIYRRNPLKPALPIGKAAQHNPLERSRNEPYTPKKYAADGLKLTKRGQLKKRK